MSDNIARAYPDNENLQITLNDRVSSTDLDVPIPVWFQSLRLATKDLARPSIDDSVCLALAQYVRKINEARFIKTDAQEQIQDATEEAEKEIEAAKKQVATGKAEKRFSAAEEREKIWRRYAYQRMHMSATSEKRIHKINVAFRKRVESLHKKLDSLEGKLKIGKKDNNEQGLEKIGADLTKTREQTEEAEKKRVELLEEAFHVLQAQNATLQEVKEKLDLQLADAKNEGFMPGTKKILALDSELEDLRTDLEILTDEKFLLKDKYAQLDKELTDLTAQHTNLKSKHADLEVEHAQLAEKYEKKKAALDKAKEMARARKNGVGLVKGKTNNTDETTLVVNGKKRAAEETETNKVEKKAKLGTEALEKSESAEPEEQRTSIEKTMDEVQKRMESRPNT